MVSCSRYSGRLGEAREPVLSGRIVELFGDSVATRGDAIHGARVHPASIRLAKGEARSVDEARAHLFDEHELVEAHALLLQPLFFEWDAFVVPSSGKYFAMADHDGVLKIVTQDQVTHQGLLHRFRDWHPKTCSR